MEKCCCYEAESIFCFLMRASKWMLIPAIIAKFRVSETAQYLKRGKVIARPLAVTIKRVNEIV